MAYVNNGTERSLKVSVYKKVGGNYVQGYPKVYDGQQSWGNPSYPTLTDIQARQLSDAAFSARLLAFKLYVESIESGADFDTDVVGDGAIRSNPGVCLPTTTTTQQPVWSFAVKYSTTAVLPSACGGIVDVAYSSKQFPGVGDILYADSALSVPWAKGGFVLMTNPAIYGTKQILVAVVSGTYSIGEIIDTANGFDCNNLPITTLTPTTVSTTTTTRLQTGLIAVDGDGPNPYFESNRDCYYPSAYKFYTNSTGLLIAVGDNIYKTNATNSPLTAGWYFIVDLNGVVRRYQIVSGGVVATIKAC